MAAKAQFLKTGCLFMKKNTGMENRFQWNIPVDIPLVTNDFFLNDKWSPMYQIDENTIANRQPFFVSLIQQYLHSFI